MKKTILFIAVAGLFAFMSSCGGKSTKFIKSPVDSLITSMAAEPNYTIILTDMDYHSPQKHYVHKYKVLKTKDTGKKGDSIAAVEIKETKTGWLPVSNQLFKKHQDDLGMEIVSKNNGKVSKVVSPPGYSQYIGNEKYGKWENRNGHSTWGFFGQYMFMSAMFHMAMFPVRRSYYGNYASSRMAGRGYYGPKSGGKSMYGTTSKMNSATNKSGAWNNRSSSFKKNSSSRISRSSSRYNKGGSSSSSSSRSRGGGSGK